MIKTDKLVYEYEKHDEEGRVIGTSRAIDELDMNIEAGQIYTCKAHERYIGSDRRNHVGRWEGHLSGGKRMGCASECRYGFSESG